jgi:hypothetical protein
MQDWIVGDDVYWFTWTVGTEGFRIHIHCGKVTKLGGANKQLIYCCPSPGTERPVNQNNCAKTVDELKAIARTEVVRMRDMFSRTFSLAIVQMSR